MKPLTQIKHHDRWIKTFLLAGILGAAIKGPSLYDYFAEKIEFSQIKKYHALLKETREVDALINVNGHCKVYIEGLSRLYDCKAQDIPSGLYGVTTVENGFVSSGKYNISSEWSALTPEKTYILSHEH